MPEYQCLCAEGMPERCPCNLIRWAEMYGHPEDWAKTAQQLHAENERLRGVLTELADDSDGHGGFAVGVARTALLVELPPPTSPPVLAENEKLRMALYALAPLADVPGTPDVVAQKMRGIIREALDDAV